MSTAIADDPMLHRVIAGKYRIEARTGAGSMGAIYRARHVSLDKVVCLKIMHDDVAHMPEQVARFEREARAASRLDHPSSVRVLDHGTETDGTMYIVMEFVDGRDLFELLADGPFAAERIVDILGQTLSALAAAHDVGILHRDLKPENIMVSTEVADDGTLHERVKVCDFGIAHLAEANRSSGPRITAKGFIVGTPEYMSPEQARAEIPDARSDLYSVGVLLFQLLTGTLPFEADTAVGVALKQVGEEPPRPRDINPTAHPALEEICLRAMRKVPAERYASAREMRSALMTALAATPSDTSHREEHATLTEEPTPAPEVGSLPAVLFRPGPWRRARSRRRAVAVLFAGAATLGITGLGVAQQHLRGPADVDTRTALIDPSRITAPSDDPVAPRAPGPTTDLEVNIALPPAPESAERPLPPPPPPPTPAPPAPPVVTAVAAAAPSPSTAAPAKLGKATPLPSYDRDFAHIEVGVPLRVSGATPLAVRAAIGPARTKLDACYRDALPRIAGSFDGSATLHVETDDVGVVRNAYVRGALSTEVGPCIARAVIGARVRNVDTGIASADVELTYRARRPLARL